MANILDKTNRSQGVVFGATPINKVDQYKWARPSTPGIMRMVPKELLNIDDTYQRGVTSQQAIMRIVRDWDWTLFKVLSVAERPDQTLWVFDGGHRTRAAFYRDDIKELPCIIFQLAELADEARAFIAGATMTCRISPIDTFRASTAAAQPEAVRTAELLAEFGMVVSKTTQGPDSLRCVRTIQLYMKQNAELTRRILSICRQICTEGSITGSLFRGLFTLADHFYKQQDRDILSEFSGQLEKVAQGELEKSMRQVRAEIGKGGDVVEAKGILAALNKGKRQKVCW